MNTNSYAGREYLSQLIKEGIVVDILLIGTFPEVNLQEVKRTGGLWEPMKLSQVPSIYPCFSFDSLKDPQLLHHIHKSKYDVGIQGGTGIIKSNLINAFKEGILNFHPGLLPDFRGCSAPEWQLMELGKVFCTCHLIDTGIDTGPIYKVSELNVDKTSYEHFRASVYPEVAKLVVNVTKELTEMSVQLKECVKVQGNGKYRNRIKFDELESLKNMGIFKK